MSVLRSAGDRHDPGQRVEVALRVAQVLDRPDDLAALDEERPVAGHAGHDRELGVDRVRVVEAGDEQAAIEAADQLVAASRRPASMTMLSGNGPYGFGAGRPWPVDATPSRAAVWAS